MQESDSFAMKEWDRSWDNRAWEGGGGGGGGTSCAVKECGRSWSRSEAMDRCSSP